MDIQAFIFNWRGHEANAIELEHVIALCARVQVINSDDRLKAAHPHWVHLDDTAYFSTQWNAAIDRFDADVMFHMQADARCADLPQMLQKAAELFETGTVGIYEPDIDFTDFRYEVAKLRAFRPNLYEIPLPDSTCWLIERSVVQRFLKVDVTLNKFGWGVAGTMAAVCHGTGKKCVRDYSVKVQHPRSRGYSSRLAMTQRIKYVESLPDELRTQTNELYRWMNSVRIFPPPAPADVA